MEFSSTNSYKGSFYMGKKIQFTQNYHDLSTTQGFQFEFYCDRCQSGFRTSFKPFATGIASNILETAGGLFGGVLGRAASVGERVRSATWERAHDQAFEAAIEELKPEFIQCPRCSAWVCREKCWNTGKGLCKNCAPDLGVEMAAAQANRSVEEIWAHAHMAEEDKKLGAEHWRETILASCPECEAPLAANVKFCPQCGYKVKQSTKCAACGAALQKGAKFCGECGAKV